MHVDYHEMRDSESRFAWIVSHRSASHVGRSANHKDNAMSFKNAITLSYDKNVGTSDRVLRLCGGAAMIGAGWYLAWPLWLSITFSVLGTMWASTAVLSKCGIYYFLGYSTCPLNNAPHGAAATARRRPNA
jgi:hypothetical protein